MVAVVTPRPAARHHEIRLAAPRELRAAAPFAEAGPPAILQRDDDDFIAAVTDSLRTTTARTALAADLAATRNERGVLKLFQPVQRRYHLALTEAWCQVPGAPRLDPARVDAAGLVLRRVRPSPQGGEALEGWMRARGVVHGWVPIARLGAETADPDPGARMLARRSGRPAIDEALQSLWASDDNAILDEQVTPMFVAPPDICAEAGRTLVYGLVQTSSSELAQTEPDTTALFEDFRPGTTRFTEHLMQPLRGLAYNFPQTGKWFDSTWYQAIEQPGATPPQGVVGGVRVTMAADLFATLVAEAAPLRKFVQLLRQVAIEFDAFGTGPASRGLFEALEAISLSYALQPGEGAPRRIGAGSFLRNARRVLLDRDPQASALEMPASWPALDDGGRARLANALFEAMKARFVTVKGRPGRFDEPGARYRLRAFVRLKAEGACPARTIWTDYSEPFVIAPWYEGAGPPVQIDLPDATDRNLLASLKPNVSFVLPPRLQNLLGGDPKKMMDGELSDDGNLSLGWICSFSIPIITLCAFIVLNIFLSLFDLFFRWMLFIKICIPYPKKG